jgi:hypothetical protein
MRYRLFGPTGLQVSELFLGAMTFGEQGGVGAPPEECALILDTFADPPHAQYLDQAAKPNGIAAGSGLVLYLAAVITHTREGAFRNISFPAAYLGLSPMSFASATRHATRPPTA